MKQSRFLLLGALEFVLVAGLLVLFGVRAALSSPLVAGMALSGACFALAGTVASVVVGPLSLSWRGLVGTGYLVFALLWPVHAAGPVLAGNAAVRGLAFLAAMLVGALSLAFFGVQVLVDGPHADVTPDVDRTLAW